MSKKMPKKSSKAATGGKTARIGTGTATAKAPKAVAKTSGTALRSASAKASHKAPSKPLKSAGSPATKSTGAPLSEGDRAPDFNLPRDGGTSVSLADHAGRKLVLFFYPHADTPGCTREAIDFTRLKEAFAACGTDVLGISADTIKAQESFRNKHELAIPLISDEKHEALDAYGAWGEKSMYGRTFLGILRTTVLIGKDGRIARIWRNVRVDGHADDVLAAAQSL